MRLLTIFAAASALAATPDAREIVRKSALLDEENDKRARSYTFVERSEERTLDGSGRVKKVEIETFDVTLLEGSPYRRLIRRNDRPLPAADERKEEQKLQKNLDERRKESEAARAKRIAEYQKRRARFRDLTKEIAEAFDWTIEREESVGGRPAWVLAAAPRPAYRGKSREGKLLRHFRGRLWVDQADYHWVRIEAEAIDTVSFGLFLFRLAQGSRIDIDMNKVNGEVWLPKRVGVKASARIGGVKKVGVDAVTTYSDYRKFSTESRLLEGAEIK